MSSPEPSQLPKIRKRDICFSLFHFSAWFILAVIVPLFLISELKETWEEFEIRLPSFSQLLVGWSDRVVRLWYFWIPLISFVAAGTSALLLFLPKTRLRRAGKSISLLLLALTFLAIVIGLGLPTLQIIQNM